MASLRAPLSRATMYKLYARSRGPKLCNDNLSRNIRFHELVQRSYATKSTEGVDQKPGIGENASDAAASKSSTASTTTSTSTGASSSLPSPISSLPPDWDDNPNLNLSYNQFDQLPGHDRNFGRNQHMNIDVEFKKAMQQVLWQFRSPIIYSFAYGSGVFPQSKGPAVTPSSKTSIHSNPDPAIVRAQTGGPKMIDFIFGVTDTAHWQSLNIREHRDHYSAIASLGSPSVSWIQDKWGAGVYFNPYVTVNGTLIKYGVVNMDILCRDLSEWDTLYLAGRLHKPVKILRDHPRVRLANQVNLISVLRTALLLLPPTFTEQELYGTIANVSYMGDPRMVLPTEDPSKVANIVGNNLPHFRKLYAPIINNLPNLAFTDGKCSEADWEKDPNLNVRLEQDMDPVKRGNMVRRLPKAFRSKLYFRYQSKFQIPQLEFNAMMEGTKDDDTTRIKRQVGGGFERRIASQPPEDLRTEVRSVIKQTIGWPSTSQSLKGPVTAGFRKMIRYLSEKMAKYREGKRKAAEAAEEQAKRNVRDRVVGKDR